MPECVVCGNTRAQETPSSKGWGEHTCPRCGKFRLTGTAFVTLKNKIANGEINAALLSHQLRKMQRGHAVPPALTDKHLEAFVGDNALPRPQEQADNLILWLGQTQRNPHEMVLTTMEEMAATAGSALPKNNSEDGLQWLIRELDPQGLFIFNADPGRCSARLTMAGWNRYELLAKRSIESRISFMAMQFGDHTLARVLRECFKPAVERAGFELRALNEMQPAGLIDNQIRAAIRSARFVVADLTHDNNGAYFEAGFAEGLSLPVIYTCEAKKFGRKKTHFDTAHMMTVVWSEDNLDEAGRALTATIRHTLPAEARLVD